VAWRRALPRAANIVRSMATAALMHGLKDAPLRRAIARRAVEVSIVLANNAAVQRLNRTYRGKDKPTNVLSFPAHGPDSGQGPCLLGDVIVAYGVAAQEARMEDKTLNAHLAHLVLHGVLHLLGYDHKDDRQAAVMERLETVIMARMGFADPYAIPGANMPGKRMAPSRRKVRP
jgi:probable rRNA maturation factor